MKKFNKSGHLRGNTDLPTYTTPYIVGSEVVNSNGSIPDLEAANTPWQRELNIQTEAGSISVTFTDTNTTVNSNAGNLQSIVSLINTESGNTIIEASVRDGVIFLESTSSVIDSYIRINPAVNYGNLATDLGLPTHPHSQATVRYGDVRSAAVNSLTQKNPSGTKFIAKGEDRSSLTYNRALTAVAVNSDSNYAMLDKRIARLVRFRLQITNGTNPRFIVDTATNTVKAIDMSEGISDSLSANLVNRVLVGGLTKTSTQDQIRRFFQVSDYERKELLHGVGGLPVRVSAVVTGNAAGSNPVGPFLLNSQPSSTLADAQVVGDNKNVFSIDIPRGSGSQSVAITGILDAYTVECSSATFKDANNNYVVYPGDTVVIQGSSTNNGTYIVENVVSATVLELKPSSFDNLSTLNTSDNTGSVSVSTGGMYLKDVTLYLTERIQLPLSEDIFITMPMEDSIGDLDETALIPENTIDVPYWVLKNIYLEKSYDGIYKGTATDRRAAGYAVDVDVRPITHTVTSYANNTEGTVDRTINNVQVKLNNRVQIDLSSNEIFTDADVGKYLRFNTSASLPSNITDAVMLPQELVVIVSRLDAKTVSVRRVSRRTQDLPTVAVTSIDVINENATPFLPGAASFTHINAESAGGTSTVLNTMASSSDKYPTNYYTNLEISKLNKVRPTANDSIFVVTTSGAVAQSSVVSAQYINTAFPTNTTLAPVSLLLQVYNGPNAGWYTISNVTEQTAGVCDLTVQTMNGTSVTFSSASISQYAAIYKIDSANKPLRSSTSRQNSMQTFTSGTGNGTDTVGAGVTWKGAGTGLVVYSNVHDNSASAVYAGVGSSGYNVYAYAGPGTSGIYAKSVGFRAFDPSLISANADLALTSDQALGGFAVEGIADTYSLDPVNNVMSSTFTYKGGGGKFLSTTSDPSIYAAKSNEAILAEQVSSAAAVLVNTNALEYGQVSSALSVYGNVFAPSLNDESEQSPFVFYTEHTLSSVNLLPSLPNAIDITENQALNSVGSGAVIARSHHTESVTFRTRVTKYDYNTFNIKHDLVLRCQKYISSDSGSIEYKSFFSPENYQDAVGSFVFFPEMTTAPGDTTFAVINSAVDNTLHSLPFKLSNEDSIQGCKIGFKVVACKVDSQNSDVCFYALSAGDRTNLSAEIALSGVGTLPASTIFYRPRFQVQANLKGYTQLGDSSTTSYSYASDSSETSHRSPVLFTEELNQSTSDSSFTISTTGLSKAIGSVGITRKGYPSSDSSLVKSTENQLPSPFMYTPSQKSYQAADYSFTPSNNIVPGFPADSLAKRGQSFSYGAHSIFVSSTNSDINNTLFVASPSKSTTAFKGGGQKLVLSASNQTVDYAITVKVGSNISKGPQGISFSMTLANSHPSLNHNISVALHRGLPSSSTETSLVTQKSVRLYGSATATPPILLFRNYQTIEVTFSADELISGRGIDEATDYDDLYIVVSNIRAESGWLLHTDLLSQPQITRERIGLATRKGLILTGYQGIESPPGSGIIIQQPQYEVSHIVSKFPDLWYIYNISVEYDQKQASLSAGLNVDGILQPRSLRMLAPVTGYEVIGPASVDLLQNSEYGNKQGHDRLYSSSGLITGSGMESSTAFGDPSTNLEGRDVGLLPLWHNLYPTATSLNLKSLQRPINSNRDAYGETWDSFPASELYNSSFTYSFTVGTAVTDKFRYGLLIPDDSTLSAITTNYFEQRVFKSTYTSMSSVSFTRTGNQDDGYAFTITYTAPITITNFYRPKFDRTSFFRKGVHAAAIHCHHPFFDPMFYWLHAASSVNFSRRSIGLETGVDSNASTYMSKYDAGSFRQGVGSSTGDGYVKIRDSKVNPDSYVPPGKTGFILNLNPPHGSKLTELKLNLSFRPLTSRGMFDRESSGNLDINYGVWSSIPDLPASQNNPEQLTGDYWLDKSEWDSKEGYVVRIWRHSPFDEGMLFGENPDGDETPVITSTSKNMEGNATLLHEHVVSLRSSTSNGGIGAPSSLVDTETKDIQEGLSRLSLVLPANDNFIVDRSVYSYFVTIEFYAGVRKRIALTNSQNQSKSCYYTPGYDYDKTDRFNASHLPYMWTTAFPGHKPTGMSSIYGNDEAVKWEGYMSPYPYSAAFETKRAMSVYRGHLLNTTGDVEEEVTYGSNIMTQMSPTPDVTTAQPDVDNLVIDRNFVVNTTNRINNAFTDVIGKRIVPDHTVWYPVIKFRGLRIAYEMDRPGHGGWGG